MPDFRQEGEKKKNLESRDVGSRGIESGEHFSRSGHSLHDPAIKGNRENILGLAV